MLPECVQHRGDQAPRCRLLPRPTYDVIHAPPPRQVVQDRLLLDAERSAAAFGSGLARGIRRLQSAEGSGSNGATDRRLLRAAALSVSKALQSGDEQ